MLGAALAVGGGTTQPYGRTALLYLAGGALYGALLGVEALLDRRRPQRAALVRVLRALAALARAQADGDADLAAPRRTANDAIDAFDRAALAHRGATGGPTRQYARAALVSRAADQLLARLLAPDADPRLSAQAADRLDTCAAALARSRRPAPLEAAEGTLVRVRTLESAIWGDPDPPSGLPARERVRLKLPGPQLLGASGRLALCTALAFAVDLAVPLDHGYWVPLTVAIVMKPDLGSVFARAVLRFAGTIGGVALVALATPLLRDPVVASAVVGALAAVVPWAAARSYVLQAFVTTPVMMVLIDVTAPATPVLELGAARVAATAIGGAIAIVAGYLIWPSARHPRIAAAFESALVGLARYARHTAVGAPAETIAQDRREAYRRLSDTRVQLQRMLSEPPPAGAEAYAWIPVVAAAERVADRITGASAARTPDAPVPSPGALGELAGELAQMASARHAPDTAQRPSRPPAHGGDDPDPAVRDLADELASLRPMVVR